MPFINNYSDINNAQVVNNKTELKNARKGEDSLGDKIDLIDSQLAEKASLTQLQANNLTFKESFATLTALQTAYPTGNAYNHAVTADGFIYTYTTSWVSTGIVAVGSGIVDGTITPKKTDFLIPGKNLFNKNNTTDGYYINQINGVLATNVVKSASEYIPCTEGLKYYVFGSPEIRLAFYNSSKVFISGVYPISTYITAPVNAAYLRFSINTASKNEVQIETGEAPTAFEVFGYKLLKPLPLENVPYNQTNFISKGKNLFNKSVAISGYYVNDVSGTLATNVDYYSSEYISILPNMPYVQNNISRLAFYTINKTFISGVTGTGRVGQSTYTTPSNAYYIRCCTKYPDSFMLETGTKMTAYEKYGIKFIDGAVRETDDLLLFLPSEICVAVGRTIELYNNQVAWCGNINNYHFKWDCTVGNALKRKLSIEGITIGEYPLVLTVYNNNMDFVKSIASTVKIVANTISAVKNILTIGDSLTNTTSTPKPWMAEVRSLSANKFNFVGTRGLVTGEKHEGRSGWSSLMYLAGTSYTFEGEGVNPFWDGSRFNWNYYKTNSLINPDIVQIWLGTNAIALDPTINANAIKQMVDYIRQDDAVIPISIAFTLYRGNQDGLGVQESVEGYSANKGAWELEEDRKVYNLMVKLYELLSGYTKLYFTPIALEHDSKYNFGAVSTPVNPRATQTELTPVEATHPQEQGYLQIADINFSVYAKHYDD